MSLSVQVEPVVVINKSGTTLTAYVIHYDLLGQNCSLYWYLNDIDGNKLYDGNYGVPSDILKNWGINDMLIMESLATSLGFVIIPPTVVTPDPEIIVTGTTL